MSGEHEAQARLEQVIEKHVQHSNVVPFPMQRRATPSPPPSITTHGTTNVVVTGSRNQVTVNVNRRQQARPSKKGRAGKPDAYPLVTAEQLRRQHLHYIETNRLRMNQPDAEVARFVQEHFGKGDLRACSAEELAIVRTQLVERWRHTF